MIITCEKCYAKFNLDENLLKQTGSKVRCSKCQNIFLAYPPIEMERVAEPAEEVVGSETVSSDVKAESVEQLEVCFLNLSWILSLLLKKRRKNLKQFSKSRKRISICSI
jgi:predicted Zn finger-like uncharacterized protein